MDIFQTRRSDGLKRGRVVPPLLCVPWVVSILAAFPGILACVDVGAQTDEQAGAVVEPDFVALVMNTGGGALWTPSPSEPEQELLPGMDLGKDAFVSTGPDSFVNLLFWDDTVVRLEENQSMKIADRIVLDHPKPSGLWHTLKRVVDGLGQEETVVLATRSASSPLNLRLGTDHRFSVDTAVRIAWDGGGENASFTVTITEAFGGNRDVWEAEGTARQVLIAPLGAGESRTWPSKIGGEPGAAIRRDAPYRVTVAGNGTEATGTFSYLPAAEERALAAALRAVPTNLGPAARALQNGLIYKRFRLYADAEVTLQRAVDRAADDAKPAYRQVLDAYYAESHLPRARE